MTADNPQQEIIRIEKDGDEYFAWLSSQREQTMTSGSTKMEALESLKWTLEDMQW